jgi:hypothetical protein
VARTFAAPYQVLVGSTSPRRGRRRQTGPTRYSPSEFGQPAANVAEYYDIPLALLHYVPVRGIAGYCTSCRCRWAACNDAGRVAGVRLVEKAEGAQRLELGLQDLKPPAS